MFDINNIQFNLNTMQYICDCQCNSPQDAKYLCAKYLTIAKTFDTIGELYSKANLAIIGASNEQAALQIACYINAREFMPALDIYIFYGSSRKKLPDRWCIGFNHSNSKQLIEMFNRQFPFVIADKDPGSWISADGQSYSVILLPGVLEKTLSKESRQRINQCLESIQAVTFRKLNPVFL